MIKKDLNKNINPNIQLNPYYLIEYKNFDILLEIINILFNNNINSIIMFKIVINKKEDFKDNLNKIKEIKEKILEKINEKNIKKIQLNSKDFINNIKKIKKQIKFAIQIKLENFDNKNISKINNLKNDFDLIIGLGGLNKQNRFFLEQTNIDFLQDPQNSYFKQKIDFIHHFNSGLNQVLCKFAKEKDIYLLFSLNFTKKLNKYLISKEIARINQNIKFVRKYEIPIYINFIISNKFEIKSIKQLTLISSLFNISTKQQKELINSITKKIKKNIEKKSKNYINKNIKLIN